MSLGHILWVVDQKKIWLWDLLGLKFFVEEIGVCTMEFQSEKFLETRPMRQRVGWPLVISKLIDYDWSVFAKLCFDISQQNRLLICQVLIDWVILLFGCRSGNLCLKYFSVQVHSANGLVEEVNLFCDCRHFNYKPLKANIFISN